MRYPTLDADAPYPLSREVVNDGDNIAPRLGITWRPFGSERTAVRGGYGLFYDSTSLGLILNAAQINGRRILSYVVPGTDARAPQYPESAGERRCGVLDAAEHHGVPRDFETMFAHQASVAIERQLTNHLLASVGYSYWGHRDAPYARDINLGPVTSTLADGRPVYTGSRIVRTPRSAPSTWWRARDAAAMMASTSR